MERAALQNALLQRCIEIMVGSLSWILIASPVWASIAVPQYWSWAYLAFSAYWLAKSMRLVMNGLLAYRTVQDWEGRSWTSAGRSIPRWRQLHHLVVFPTYGEPSEVLDASLGYLLRQDFPHGRVTVLLAFEARDSDAPAVAERLRQKYGNEFRHFWTAYHPDRSGEVRGKSSNLAYALPWAKRRLVEELGVPLENVLVTICDADSRLHPKYLSALSYQYLTVPNAECCLYQPPLLFHANLHRLPGPLRALNGLISIMSLARLRRRYTLVTQSTYSLSLATCNAVNYWDVDVIPEDSHILFKVLFRLGPQVTVQPIYLPVWADAAEGRTWWSSLTATYRQVRRWSWGVVDLSYLLWHGSRSSTIPPWLRVVRVGYYVKEHLFWPANWFIMMGGLRLLPITAPLFSASLELKQINAWTSTLYIASFFCLVPIVWLDQQMRARYRPHSAPPEPWHLLANWLLIPALGFFVSALPAADAHRRLLFGKRLEYQVTQKLAAQPSFEMPAPHAVGEPLHH